MASPHSSPLLLTFSPRTLAVFSLDRPSIKSTHSLQLKSDPVGLQWHPNDGGKLALVRYSRCEVLLWDSVENRIDVTLNIAGYVRPITSFDWSPVHPNLIATTSADQFRAICIWDLRDLSRPARAIESLSEPTRVKWNRKSEHVFAAVHRPGLRLWDLRQLRQSITILALSLPYPPNQSSYPEPCLSDPTKSGPAVIRDFDWSPSCDDELASVDSEGLLRVWHTKRPTGLSQQPCLTSNAVNRVCYTPSGGELLTFPEPSAWSNGQVGVWNASNLLRRPPIIWTTETSLLPLSAAVTSSSSYGTAVVQPLPTDPAVLDVAWRTPLAHCSHAMVAKQFEDECFTHDEVVGPTNVRPRVELVILSADNQLRFYPVQSSVPHYTESQDPAVSSSSTISAIATKSNVESHAAAPTAERRPTTSSGRRVNQLSGARHKHTVDGSKGEAVALQKLPSTGLITGSASNRSTELNSSPENIAYQILAQEFSLLSPRTGQYKMEEVDLLNRTSKMKLFYCRRQHEHHYSVCSEVSQTRDRRPSCEIESARDLDSLLLSPNVLLPVVDNSCLPGGSDWSNEVSSECTQDSTTLVSSDQVAHAMKRERARQMHALTTVRDCTSQNGGLMIVPVAGTVLLSISFPIAYPAVVPVFTIVGHSPTLPRPVVSHILHVLNTTAAELVNPCHGCMEPCIRKAIDALQTISTIGRTIPTSTATQRSTDSYSVKSASCPNNLEPIDPKMETTEVPRDAVDVADKSRIPFPRLCGAHFTAAGHLIAFGLSPTSHDSASNIPRDLAWRTLGDFRRWRHCLVQQQKHRDGETDPIRRASVCTDSRTTVGSVITRASIESNGVADVNIRRKLTEPNIGADRHEVLHGFLKENPLHATKGDSIKMTETVQPASDAQKTVKTTDSVDASDFVPEPLKQKTSWSSDASKNNTVICQSTVQLYDFSGWILNKKLIQSYCLNIEDVQQMCAHNYLVSMDMNRKDVIKFWQYAVVLAASLSPISKRYGNMLPPVPTQPIGRLLFNKWLVHFLSLRDVQHLVMAILVLQGLDALYSTNMCSPLLSDNCLTEANATAQADTTRLALSSDLMTDLQHSPKRPYSDGDSICQVSMDRERHLSDSMCASSLVAQVSFNLNTLDELQDQCTPVVDTSMTFGGTTRTGEQASIVVPVRWSDSCIHPWRFIHPDDIPHFAHYTSVYASILYATGSFLHHTHLLRAWTWSLLTHRAPSMHHGPPIHQPNMDILPQWPRNGIEPHLLPSCPFCSSNVFTSPVKHSTATDQPAATGTRVQCEQCMHTFLIPHQSRQLGSGSVSHADVGQCVTRIGGLQCSICRTQARGLVFVCPQCHHGGHVDHLFQWFSLTKTTTTRTTRNLIVARRCPSLDCQCYCADPQYTAPLVAA